MKTLTLGQRLALATLDAQERAAKQDKADKAAARKAKRQAQSLAVFESAQDEQDAWEMS